MLSCCDSTSGSGKKSINTPSPGNQLLVTETNPSFGFLSPRIKKKNMLSNLQALPAEWACLLWGHWYPNDLSHTPRCGCRLRSYSPVINTCLHPIFQQVLWLRSLFIQFQMVKSASSDLQRPHFLRPTPNFCYLKSLPFPHTWRFPFRHLGLPPVILR